MSPCVCSVIDHRWGQNVVKTIMKWHTSRSRVCHWCFYHTDFHVLCDLLLSRPTATWNLFVLYNDQKIKKTDTRTCLVPLECSRICTSLGIFWVPKRYFSSLPLLFFFILIALYTVSSNSFSTSFLAQSRIMAKTFCKSASLSYETRWQLLLRFLVV